MFVADCTAALALTLAAMEWETLAWVNAEEGRWAGTLTTDLAHWAESGIVSASDLSAMLEAECERERRKDDLWGEMTPEERAEEAAYYADMRAEWEAHDAHRAAEEAEEALWRVWDYDVTEGGRILLAA